MQIKNYFVKLVTQSEKSGMSTYYRPNLLASNWRGSIDLADKYVIRANIGILSTRIMVGLEFLPVKIVPSAFTTLKADRTA
jgi:hypothetical protein